MTHEALYRETDPTQLTDEELEHLRTLADEGDDATVLAHLQANNLYEHTYHHWCIDRLPREDATIGALLTNLPLTPQDRDRLLVQWLHHHGTGWHAVKTGDLVRVILDHSPELLRAIEKEGITRDEVLRSACLHDEGKKSIPRSVLAAHPTDDDCWALLQKLHACADIETNVVLTTLAKRCGLDISADMSWETLRTTLECAEIRPVRAIPVRQLLKERPDTLDTLEARGCATACVTLLDIIGEHERFTRERLKDEPRIAEIAGHHHTPHESTFPMAAGTVGVSSRVAQQLLYAADVIEALTAERDYKTAWSLTKALCTEINETLSSSDHLSDFVTYHVVSTLMHHSVNTVSSKIPDTERDTINTYLAQHGEPCNEGS